MKPRIPSVARLSYPFALALAGLLFSQAVYAQSNSWASDAAGNWSNAASWTGGVNIPGSTTADNTHIATFNNLLTAARTVTVDANRFIGGITFGATNTSTFGYTISGGPLRLNSGGVIQTTGAIGANTTTISSSIQISGASAATASFTSGPTTAANGVISISGGVTGSATANNTATLTLNGNGTGSNTISGIIGNGSGGGTLALTKSGTGTWVLSGANTYSGGTTLSAGTLAISNASSLGVGNVSVSGTSRINTTQGNGTARTFANNIAVNAALTMQNPQGATGATSTFSGQLTGSNSITVVAGGGNGILAGIAFTNTSNTFTGNIIMPSGTTASSPTATGNDVFSFNSIGDGGTFTFRKRGHTNQIAYTGATAIVFNTRAIALANEFGGPAFDGGGTNPVNQFSNNATDAANTVTFNTNISAATVNSAGYLFFSGSNTGNNAFTGIISDMSNFALNIGKTGAGRWVFSGANSYSGETLIRNGTLSVNALDVIANNQPLGKNLVIQLGQNADSGILEFTGSADSTTDKQVRIGGSVAAGTGAGSILNNSSGPTGALTFSAATFNPLIGSSTGARTLTIGGSYANAPNLIQGVIQNNNGTNGVVSLTKAGASSWSLSGNNTFSGNIIVNAGTLIGAGATNSPGISAFGSRANSRSITVNNGGTLQFNSGNILGANHVAITAPTLIINSGGTVTNGGIASNNALNNVQLNSGTLTSTTGHTGSSAPFAPVYGAWNINGTVTSTGTSTISTSDPSKGWLMLKVVGDKTTEFNVTGTLTVSAPVVDNPTDGNIGSLLKTGTGSMILTAANTYTGSTTVSAGTLRIGNTGVLNNTDINATGSATFSVEAGSGTVNIGNTATVGAGASLDLASGTSFTMVDGIAGGTTNLVQEPTFPGDALTVSSASMNFELSSAGADKLAVAGRASLTGANIINIVPLGALTAGTYDLITASSGLDTGGTFVFGSSGTTTQTVVSGTDSYLLTLNNSAGATSVTVGSPVSVPGGITWTGQTNGIGADDAIWSNSAGANWAVGTSPVVFSNGVAVTFNDTNSVTTSFVINNFVTVAAGGVIPASTTFHHSAVDYTLSGGAIGGSGALNKSGTATLALNAANTYTGATSVSAGTLRIGNASSLGSGTGPLDGTTISAGATLDLGGVNNGQSSATGTERITVSGTGFEGNGAIVSSSPLVTPFIGIRYLTLAGNTTLGFSNRWDVGSSTAANNGFVGGGHNLTFLGTGTLAQASLNFLGETDLGDINVNLGTDVATNILFIQGDTTLGRADKTLTVSGGSAIQFFTNVTNTSYDKKLSLDNGLINFNRASTTFSLPGTISLTNANTFTSNISSTTVIANNVISGNGSLTKAGPGILTLSGVNTYSGITSVDAGLLRLTSPSALGGTASGVVVNGNNGGAATNARLELSGGIIVAGESATLKGNGNFLGALQSSSGSNEWAGNVLIDADLTRIGAATGAALLVSGAIDDGINDYRLMYRINDATASVTLTGANTYTGPTSIVGLGPVIVGSLNKVIGGAPSSNLGAPTTEATGRITIGTTTVNGFLRYVGNGETTDRTIQIGENNASTPAAADTGSATIESSGATGELVFNAPIFNSPTNAATGTTPTRTLTLSGSNTNANAISGVIQNNQIASSPTAAVIVAKAGTGAWTLSGANTYTGGTTISGGSLRVNSIADSGTSAIGTSGTLTLAGGTLAYTAATAASTARSVSITANSTIDLPNGSLSINSGIAGGGFIVTKSNIGTLTLGGSTDNGSFFLNVTGGVVELNKSLVANVRAVAGISGVSAGAVVKLTGAGTDQIYDGPFFVTTNGVNGLNGILDLNGKNESTSNFDGGITGVVDNTSDTACTFTIGTQNVSSTFGGTIQNTGGSVSIIKTGTGTQTLSGINTYTGNTTVSAGILILADNAQLKFVLGAASGSNNSITGVGTATLNGDFVIDTSAADSLATGSWTLENVSTLTEAYGSSFTVVGFTDAGNNKWTKINGTKIYTFDETTGVLTLAPNASYTSWAAVNAIDSLPGQDKDGDGVSNAIEYVLGGSVTTNDLGKLPTFDASGANLVFTFRRNRESIDGTTTVQIEVGTSLNTWPGLFHVGTTTANSSAGVTVAENTPTGFDTITLTVPKGTDTTKFGRLKVTVP